MSILPQLESDLRRAAQRQFDWAGIPDPAEPEHPRPWRTLKSVRRLTPIVASVVVVLVVAGAALVLLHGSGSEPAPAVHGNLTQREGSRKTLIASLRVLRRRQTPADLDSRLLPPFVRRSRPLTGNPAVHARLRSSAGIRLDRPLVRLVSVPRLDAKVSVAPVTYRVPSSANHLEGLYVDIHAPGTGLEGDGPISVNSFLAHGIEVTVEPHHGRLASFFLVPDGVARVRVGQLRDAGHLPGVSRAAVTAAMKASAQTTAVHDNLAAFDLPLPHAITSDTAISQHVDTGATASVTWYGASGRVLRHIRAPIGTTITVHGRARPSTSRPPAASAFCQQNPNACGTTATFTTTSP